MSRSITLLLIAVVLGGYGLYAAGHVPALLAGPLVPLLLIGFVLQAIFGFAAAFGTWRPRPWAGAAAILLGVCIAGTWLSEAFILGIVAYLSALAAAAIALIATVLIAAYLDRAGARLTA